MIALSNATLSGLGSKVRVPGYDRAAVRPGIVHFGVGNFHRTHQAVYVDDCLHRPGCEGWGIVGIGMTDGPAALAKAAAFRAQDCLYTVTEFAPDGATHIRVIGAMVGYLHAPTEAMAVIDVLAHAETRIVTLTITEGGYNLSEVDGAFRLDNPDVAHDLAGGPPRSVFGLVVSALARRRAAGLPGFTIASCDNLRRSGDTTRAAFVAFAHAVDPALAAWIDGEVDFPNAMVDRIAPQTTDASRAGLNARSGVDDRLPAAAETYIQWVVKDRFRHGRPPLEAVGVEFSDRVAEYVAVKGRMLNGAHMMLAYPAALCGYRIVSDAMADPRFVRLLTAFLERDVIPYIQPPPGIEPHAYMAMVLDRFGNPATEDQVLRVAGDGAAKLPIYHSKTLSTLVEANADIRREAFLLACFARYLKARDDRSIRDDRGGGFAVLEPGLTVADWDEVNEGDPVAVLRTSPFQALGLDRHPAFRAAYEGFYAALVRDGASRTLDAVLA